MKKKTKNTAPPVQPESPELKVLLTILEDYMTNDKPVKASPPIPAKLRDLID
jgi:hypothetical protein